MNDTNNYISCNIVEKFGDDDFSLWTVDIKEANYKDAMTDFVRVSGDPATILNNLPTEKSNTANVLHFMFINSSRSEIISIEVADAFIAYYHNQGCSVRGSLKDIMDEIKISGRLIVEKESVIQTIRDSKQNPSPRKNSKVRSKSEPDL